MLDLCKIFGVEEGEKFKIYDNSEIYRVKNNKLEYLDDDDIWNLSCASLNQMVNWNVIKYQPEKYFTEDELNILKNIDKKYKYIARDKKYDNDNIEVGRLFVFTGYPTKSCDMWDVPYERDYSEIPFNDIFKSIQWEDDEPVCIDDYVTRNKGDE